MAVAATPRHAALPSRRGECAPDPVSSRLTELQQFLCVQGGDKCCSDCNGQPTFVAVAATAQDKLCRFLAFSHCCRTSICSFAANFCPLVC